MSGEHPEIVSATQRRPQLEEIATVEKFADTSKQVRTAHIDCLKTKRFILCDTLSDDASPAYFESGVWFCSAEWYI